MRELEAFVDANAAAEFLCITRRRVIELARSGNIPAHSIANRERKTWRFRLSEIAVALSEKSHIADRSNICPGGPRQPNRRN